MDKQYLLSLLKQCKMSPEELGELMGVSGMTIRRWIEKSGNEPLPEIYQTSLREAVYKMIVEGQLDAESKLAQKCFAEPGSYSQRAALKALGFPEDIEGNFENNHEKIMVGLSQMGASEARRKRVDEEKKTLPRYKKLGKEWAERISILSRVIASKNLTAIDKFPAYGALFYLFMPFDLIPDSIPVFGLMDDYAILGIAAAYYLNKLAKEKKQA